MAADEGEASGVAGVEGDVAEFGSTKGRGASNRPSAAVVPAKATGSQSATVACSDQFDEIQQNHIMCNRPESINTYVHKTICNEFT